MKKKTVYRIEGKSDTDPRLNGDLPEGFEVVAEEVTVIPEVEVPTLVVEESPLNVSLDGECVRFRFIGRAGDLISFDSARKVRDTLNEILDEPREPSRVLAIPRDLGRGVVWRWYETKPGLFTYAGDRHSAERDSASGRRGHCINRTLDQVREDSGTREILEVLP
jgi:hypothetical protein